MKDTGDEEKRREEKRREEKRREEKRQRGGEMEWIRCELQGELLFTITANRFQKEASR